MKKLSLLPLLLLLLSANAAEYRLKPGPIPGYPKIFEGDYLVWQKPADWATLDRKDAPPPLPPALEVLMYVPQGQTANDWREAVIVYGYSFLNRSVKAVDVLEAKLKDSRYMPSGCEGYWRENIRTGRENNYEYVATTYFCGRSRNTDYGEIVTMKALMGAKGVLQIIGERVSRVPPFSDPKEASAEKITMHQQWFDTFRFCSNIDATRSCPPGRVPTVDELCKKSPRMCERIE